MENEVINNTVEEDIKDSGNDNFKCKLEMFEGPLDLLLYLIKKNEIDINNIKLENVTSQYLDYISYMQSMNIDIASEFIVTAATLLHIKTRWLLPIESNQEDEDLNEFDDPRLNLLEQLLEYKKFKEAGAFLDKLQEKEHCTFTKGHTEIYDESDDDELVVTNVSVFDLCKAFNEVLKKIKTREPKEVHKEKFTVQDKIAQIRELLQTNEQISFSKFFEESQNKEEILCAFLGILELIRSQEIIVEQREKFFGEIIIKKKIALAPVLA